MGTDRPTARILQKRPGAPAAVARPQRSSPAPNGGGVSAPGAPSAGVAAATAPARDTNKMTTGPAAATPARDSSENAYLARRTELVLKEIEQLPTLPSVATRLLQLGLNDDTEIREIVRVIETDPTLTARLLGMCKKAAMRTRVPITTVEMAVVMLGLESVRALVLSLEIFDWTRRLERPDASEGTAKGSASTRPGRGTTTTAAAMDAERVFSRVGFWQHSIAVACAADLITREHPRLEFRPEEAFVCGLVHDLGKLALDWLLPKAFARVVDLASHHRAELGEFERAVVGLDHAQVGEHLARRWGLPELVCDAIAMHHSVHGLLPINADAAILEQALQTPGQRVAALVAVADDTCRRLSLGWSGNHGPTDRRDALCAAIGLDPDVVDAVAPKLYELATARSKELGLGEEPSQQLLIESILRANARLGKLNQELAQSNSALEAAQNQLAEARTLARLGQMTAGAAHEMNNPLAVISGRAQTLLSRLRDDRDKQACQSIIEGSLRLTGLIARLNRIACPPQPTFENADVSAMLSDAITRAKARYAAGVEAQGLVPPLMSVKLSIDADLPTARLARDLMTDALVEIIVNAMEAKPRSGVEVRAGVDAEGLLRFDVLDDGVGMNERALAHALDPFFSDKPAGRQSGLGLALADRLVRLNGGEIVMSSKPGKGTTVSVRMTGWRGVLGGEDAATGPGDFPRAR